MPFYTPLRYPGGKRRLASVVVRLLNENGIKDVQYIEPYAGGAAIGLMLLLEEYASVIHINDLSRPVYAFWHSVLNHTAEMCRRIERTKITMREWHRQRAVYDMRESADLLDLGFATLFLNRTNRSGIIAGGVIGGKNQTGEWALDARFNKSGIIQRISTIGRYACRIRLYQQDALDFTNQVIPALGKNTFTFYDPPYIENGKGLYLNNYTLEDHRKLASRIAQLKQMWVVTYDHGAIQHRLYQNRRIVYGLRYSAQTRCKADEVMFLSDRLKLPTSWASRQPVAITTKRNEERPVYGIMEAMKAHPKMEEGPKAGERFMNALKTVLAVPKSAIPNPFKQSSQKKQKPVNRKG